MEMTMGRLMASGCLFLLFHVGTIMAKTIHLISSSSEYLEQIIPDIVSALKRQRLQVNMQYLDQQVYRLRLCQ